VRLILTQPQLSFAPGADNVAAVRSTLDAAHIGPHPEDILVLPEHHHQGTDRAAYEAEVSALAKSLGSAVIGGSQHEQRGTVRVHRGVAANAEGEIIGSYEKLRPYANERAFVEPGQTLGELEVNGRRVLVLICADFWFSDLTTRASRQPDMILIPALSVSRKPTPDYSRAMWRHLAVARAYELGAYVGVSDWGHPSELPMLASSGVAGFADPTMVEPELLFQPVENGGAGAFPLDFVALEAFRADRRARGFFWMREG
jgi:predicted amidohydrolase